MLSLKKYKRLKASSIMESVIAISIISICALAAFTIYLNVVRQNKSMQYYNAKHMVNLLAYQSFQQSDYEDNSYSINEGTIEKRVNINNIEHVAYLSFTIKLGKKTEVMHKIISYNEY